jgi:hypothetical protein
MAIDSGPSEQSYAVTPHDSTAIPVGRALYVGVAGDVVGQLAKDTADRTFKNMAAGEHPLRFKLIKSTGTTATDMLVLF